MKRLITYSIWGNSPRYSVGLMRNIELCEKIYKGWIIRVYHNNTSEVLKELDGKVELVDMSQSQIPGYFWRFLPVDVERFISRDTDSRVSVREKTAVDEWLESGKSLHIMRDHPHHGKHMMAGMWGMKINPSFYLESHLNSWLRRKGLFNVWKRDIDEDFLRDVVYAQLVDDSIAHDSICRNFPHSKSFPMQMQDHRFVGEIIDENENRFPQWQYWVNRKEL